MKIGRFVDTMDDKTNLLRRSINFAPHIKIRGRKRKMNIEVETKVAKKRKHSDTEKPMDDREPNDPLNKEMWSKKSKTRKTPKHVGQNVLKRYKKIINTNNDERNEINIFNSDSITKILVLKNGDEEINRYTVFNIKGTCAFDSLFQVLSAILIDDEVEKTVINNIIPNPMINLLYLFEKDGLTYNFYLERNKMLKSCFAEDIVVVKVLDNCTFYSINCVSNPSKSIKHFLTEPVNVVYRCPQKKCMHEMKLYNYPIHLKEI